MKANWIYLSLILTLHCSCLESNSTEKKDALQHPQRSTTDTLNFTSAIRAIFQDSKGNYWFGSHAEGVCCYNGASFRYFSTAQGLPDNQIRSIQEDSNGKIWLGTANGISVYDQGTFTNYPPTNDHPQFDWRKTKGDLWFYAWEEDGINRFDGTNMHYLIFPKPENKKGGKAYGVTGISKDKNGKVWMATYAALFSYDDKVLHTFDAKKLHLKEKEQLHIRSVLVDSKDRIWIGDNGMGVLLMENNSSINFSEKNNLIPPSGNRNGDHQPQPGTLKHPFAMEEDSEGNIWFGDVYTGAWKYDGEKISNYSVSDRLPKPMIWTIYNDRNNNLLFGLADGTVYRFNGKTFDRHF